MATSTDTERWHPTLWSLWAKSGEDDAWLSIPQHMIDSAEIAGLLWDGWMPQGVKRLLTDETGLNASELRALVTWLAGGHDLGKIDSQFIGQIDGREEHRWLVDKARTAGLTFPQRAEPGRIPHSHISEALVSTFLQERTTLAPHETRAFSAVAGAHHGLPVHQTGRDAARAHVAWLPAPWQTLQQAALEAVTAHTHMEAVLPRLTKPLSAPAQMVLTGLVIMTDWIASNTEACPLSSSGRHGGDPRQRAEVALEFVSPTAPWHPAPPEAESAEEAYRQRFGWPEAHRARPMQEAAVSLVKQIPEDSGGLLVVEAPMGQGKTEAALLCAELLAEKTRAGGIAVAAPTMATADGLLQRVVDWAGPAMGGEDAVSSLFLAHSKSGLNPVFRKMRFGDIGQTPGGTVVAHQWLSGRKKGILSNAVVGTVDQILFMALQSKHMMLRHLGLAQKVVVIDEVHAYDSYMSKYLEKSLTWLGAYGAPVILLSATLPASRKEALMRAYLTGLKGKRRAKQEQLPAAEGYPLLTVAHADGIHSVLAPAGVEDQQVGLELIPDDENALREVLRLTVERGGCTAVVCSTVDRAQQAFRIAEDLVRDDAVLLHSRFTANQRVQMEADLLAELGPRASLAEGTRPQRRIVVATQVIEQSLDLDFDFMVTDIAPSDLVLQRMGRLHRHQRPKEERPQWATVPRVAVRGFAEVPREDEPPVFDDLLTLIYPEALLLRSCVALGLHHTAPEVAVPSGIPEAVHATYEEPDVPLSWHRRHGAAAAEHLRYEDQSRQRALTFQISDPRSSETLTDLFTTPGSDVDRNEQSEQEGLAQVRDTSPSLEVLLVHGGPAGYRPLLWADEEADFSWIHLGQEVPEKAARLIAESSVRLPFAFSKDHVFAQSVDELERRTDPAWQTSHLLRGQLMLALDEEGRAELAGRELLYDRKLGLIDLTSAGHRAAVSATTQEGADPL